MPIVKSVETGSLRAGDVECVKDRLEAFGQPLRSPVRDEISRLRRRRADGALSQTDYVVKVAELLGAAELGSLSAP